MSTSVPSDGIVLWFVLILTLLLVTFVYEVLSTPLDPVAPAETPAPRSRAHAAPAPLPRRQVREPEPFPPAPVGRHADRGYQHGEPGYPGEHASPARAPEARPRVSGRPPWGPAPRPPGA